MVLTAKLRRATLCILPHPHGTALLMPYERDPVTGKQIRGFARNSPTERARISALGGAAVPSSKRSFAKSPTLAASAGRTGGEAPHTTRGHRRSSTPIKG